MQTYLISGIGPSEKGAGRLLKELIEYNDTFNKNVEFIYFYAKSNMFTQLLKKTFVFEFAKSVYYKTLSISPTTNRIGSIKNSTVLIMHPQTLGYDNLFQLSVNNNSLYIYVLDNSFFCLRSYNHIIGEFGPCLKCIGNGFQENALKNGCSPWPVQYAINKNIEYLKKLRSISKNITFFVQNKNQGKLIKKHFGDDSKTHLVGMYTSELQENDIISKSSDFKYDIVYHGSCVEAKGLLYTLEISKYLKKYKILIPYNKSDVARELRINLENLDNIIYKPMTWESGLQSTVKNSKLIFCPSLWSAPIEGAFIKSIMQNGCVASFISEYTFAQELPKDSIIRLESDFLSSAQSVEQFLINPVKRSEIIKRSQKWIHNYLKQKEARQRILFSTISK